jgi:hypothetical protein
VAVEALNAGYSSIPSRILGQRGPVGGATPAAQQSAPGQAPGIDVQKQIEDLLSPVIGKRLSQSYAQTKVQMKVTPGLVNLDQSIGAVGKSLSKSKSGTFSESAGAFAPKTPVKGRSGGAAGGAGAGGGGGGRK